MSVTATGRQNTGETINHAFVFLVTGGLSLVGAFAALDAGPTWLSFATVVFGAFPVILVHELGHALAAWAVGWRVWIVHVAPFSWRLRPFSLRLVGNYEGPDIGGFMLGAPRLAAQDTKWRDAFVSAGGPLASWALAAALIGLSAPGPTDRYDVEDWRNVVYALGMFSLAAAIGSSLPLVMRDGSGNDAARIQARLDGALSTRPHAEWALLLWNYGVEPRDWDEGLRASVEAARCTPAQAEAPAYFDFVAAIRSGDADAARAAMVQLGASWRDEELTVLEAYLRAALDDDGAGAQVLMARASILQGDDAELSSLRELTFVEIDRLDGDERSARKRLKGVRLSLMKQPIGKQPHWRDLIAAARTRLGRG